MGYSKPEKKLKFELLSFCPFKNRVTTVYGPFGYRYLLDELDVSPRLCEDVYSDPQVGELLDKVNKTDESEAEAKRKAKLEEIAQEERLREKHELLKE